MPKIKLFLKEYDRGGQNERISERVVTVPVLPGEKQYLLVKMQGRVKPFFVSNSYMPVDLASDVAAYVFATATSAPYQEAVKVGISEDEAGVPSLTNFEGRTVGDLMAFLSEYPAEDEVVFSDREILVAQTKEGMVILRLDDAADYK